MGSIIGTYSFMMRVFRLHCHLICLIFLISFSFQEGQIDMLSSDHSPSVPELKLFDEGDFLRAWGGISSLQVGLFFIHYMNRSLFL